jgi:uncharacterized protein YjiS (DUF1127 family)
MNATTTTRHPGDLLPPPCRSRLRRLIDALLDRWLEPSRGAADLRELDPHTLADLGLHPSELGSVEAESRGPRQVVTRRRILVSAHP